MSKSKKPIIYITCFFLVLSSVIIPYYNSKANELVIATGLASSGTALLGLLAMSGVGMELENNRKFNDLSDSEKARIENGLAQNFEDVALQRGASLEKIKTWTSDLCSGVLDKASECWSIFKDWAKNISLTDSGDFVAPDVGSDVSPNSLIGFSGITYGKSFVINSNVASFISSKKGNSTYYGYIITQYDNETYSILAITSRPKNGSSYVKNEIIYGTSFRFYLSGNSKNFYPGSNISLSFNKPYFQGIMGSYPFMNDYVDENGYGFVSQSEIFSTNTDYLERLKGQEKEQVEIIDVTDIKNPIVESKGNSIARIDWNRGTNNNNNNDDDEQTIKGGLVPADVWYESLDDYIDGQNNAIETFDEHIAENPEDKDKYFISPSPIVNISQFYDVLPVVPVPTAGTIVNNYYTYNNYNTFNNTIYNEPYNPELVPNIPILVFENKFPFCIPWDLFNFVSAFYVEKEAPRIDIPFPIKGANGLDIQTVTIDLSGYEYLSTIIRVMFFVLFLVGLMILTRQLIKG